MISDGEKTIKRSLELLEIVKEMNRIVTRSNYLARVREVLKKKKDGVALTEEEKELIVTFRKEMKKQQ